MCIKDPLRIAIEQGFAGLQPSRGFGSESAAIKIQLFDLVEPALQLFQLDVVLFELVVSKVLRGGFPGDFGFKIVAFVDQLAVGVVPIGFEAGENLFLLQTVEGNGFENYRLPAHLGNVVLDHLEPPRVVVGPRQKAHAILQIDGPHPLQPSPQADALCCRLSRNLVCQQQPWNRNHGAYLMLRS